MIHYIEENDGELIGIGSITSGAASALTAWEELPWYKKLITKRPKLVKPNQYQQICEGQLIHHVPKTTILESLNHKLTSIVSPLIHK